MAERHSKDFAGGCNGSAREKWMRIPHKEEPNLTKPLLEIPAEVEERMLSRLDFLYGEDEARKWLPELERILKIYCAYKDPAFEDSERGFNPANRFTEKDMILIAYGDLLRLKGNRLLQLWPKSYPNS